MGKRSKRIRGVVAVRARWRRRKHRSKDGTGSREPIVLTADSSGLCAARRNGFC